MTTFEVIKRPPDYDDHIAKKMADRVGNLLGLKAHGHIVNWGRLMAIGIEVNGHRQAVRSPICDDQETAQKIADAFRPWLLEIGTEKSAMSDYPK